MGEGGREGVDGVVKVAPFDKRKMGERGWEKINCLVELALKRKIGERGWRKLLIG